MATFFTFLFAFACLATFASGFHERWKGARIISAMTAVLSFLLALACAART
jgi:hypothetical protein